ncbi:hypothetical protein [Thermococcus thioreducens]|uniref:Uncharacterized protein n=1 Tax=Thermococcus thioreducens TaxID=277988 RepID=A0A0Q2S7H6_9EURY|nr:hypothetical protein [Thermococcus thioreducens]ASJ13332.1 hypothetical protein A3L14_10770 [Thermococcus thioreducens]KQH83259.1 hypothetical protein AMR53_00840 [Thermococcus thioreducens]SEW22763.1 hypothetical protein SAMN05216170_2259 [Thermococcus thioreducens]
MRLLKAVLLSVVIMTLLVFPIEKNVLTQPISEVVLVGQGIIVPSSGMVMLSSSADEGTEYDVKVFDPESGRAVLERNVSGSFRGRVMLEHSGPYYFSVQTMTPVTMAVRIINRYPSVTVLNIRYGLGGVSALLLAAILLVEGIKK